MDCETCHGPCAQNYMWWGPDGVKRYACWCKSCEAKFCKEFKLSWLLDVAPVKVEKSPTEWADLPTQ